MVEKLRIYKKEYIIPKMSEMKHPRFNGENEANVDIKIQFAEEALNALMSHGVVCITVDQVETVEDGVTVTPRYDCPTEQRSIYASVRLRELNQSYYTQASVPLGPNETLEPIEHKHYTALVLETAEYNDVTGKNLNTGTDEIEQWDDYVAIIFETGVEEKNISIVNAATGEELGFDDIMEAYTVFSALKSYLESERFEAYIAPEDYTLPAERYSSVDIPVRTEKFQTQDGTTREYIDFNPAYYHFDYKCPECGAPGPLCPTHGNAWKS